MLSHHPCHTVCYRHSCVTVVLSDHTSDTVLTPLLHHPCFTLFSHHPCHTVVFLFSYHPCATKGHDGENAAQATILLAYFIYDANQEADEAQQRREKSPFFFIGPLSAKTPADHAEKNKIPEQDNNIFILRFFHPILCLRPSFSCSLLLVVVTQIRGHVARSSPPFPLLARAFPFHHDK